MSNVKVLARVVVARRRLRDLSAGEMAIADQARQDAETARVAASHAHDVLLEQTASRVTHIDSVRGLELLQEERQGARAAIAAAYAEVRRRVTVVEERRQALNRRERDLRGSERQLEGARHERAARLDKVEQQASDELAGATMFRRAQ